MKSRILTALILIPPVVYLIGWSPLWLFLLAVLLVAGLALHEYFAICRASGYPVLSVLGYVGVGGMCLARALAVTGARDWTLAIPGVLVLVALTLALVQIRELKGYLTSVSLTTLGVIYVGMPLAFLIPLRFRYPEWGFHWMFSLFVIIWAGDIFAYFVGRTVGRHLLFPRVSPKKTWEGAVAGFAGSLTAGWSYAHWVWKTPDTTSFVIFAAVIAVAGQVGDLAESALKRGANMKDSGSILPGHGGVLDRIDALLFGSAALWLVLAIKDVTL